MREAKDTALPTERGCPALRSPGRATEIAELPHGKGQEEVEGTWHLSMRGSSTGAGQSCVALELVKQLMLQLTLAEP